MASEQELRAAVTAVAWQTPQEAVLDAAVDELLALRAAVARLTAARAREAEVLAAADDWGEARHAEQLAVSRSVASDHRGPAWFARCVAGETREAAALALLGAWERWRAATPAEGGTT